MSSSGRCSVFQRVCSVFPRVWSDLFVIFHYLILFVNSLYLSIYQIIHLSVCLSIYLSIPLFAYLLTYLFICSSIISAVRTRQSEHFQPTGFHKLVDARFLRIPSTFYQALTRVSIDNNKPVRGRNHEQCRTDKRTKLTKNTPDSMQHIQNQIRRQYISKG